MRRIIFTISFRFLMAMIIIIGVGSSKAAYAQMDSPLILKYENGSWKYFADFKKGGCLESIYLDQSGTKGWAIGYGTMYKISKGNWKYYEGEVSKYIHTVWMNQSGSKGWVIGGEHQWKPKGESQHKGEDRAIILKYENGKWVDLGKNDEFKDLELNALWMDSSGTKGWAVGKDYQSGYHDGDKGVILKFENNKWARYSKPDEIENELYSIWMDDSGKTGWAMGKSVIKYENGEWKEFAKFSTPYITIKSIWVDQSNTKGWAVGYIGSKGLILKYENGEWKQHSKPTNELWTIWMDKSGSKGWAMGYIIMKYENGEWKKIPKPKMLWRDYKYEYSYFNSIWMDPSGKKGWAVGGCS